MERGKYMLGRGAKSENEWSELGAEIKVGAWSETVKDKWSKLGVPK